MDSINNIHNLRCFDDLFPQHCVAPDGNEIGSVDERSSVNIATDCLFHRAVEHTLRLEGERCVLEHTAFGSGISKFGIASHANPEVDIRNLKKDEAIRIYYQKYWAPYRLDKIAHAELAIRLFDIGVNIGVARAHGMLRQVLNVLYGWSFPIDGVLNTEMIDYLNSDRVDCRIVVALLQQKIVIFYLNLTNHNVAKRQYLRGWLNRVFDAVQL